MMYRIIVKKFKSIQILLEIYLKYIIAVLLFSVYYDGHNATLCKNVAFIFRPTI
jgi:hypothetical protein